jgi:succinate-semialdehyde dehydrogenase / glutarate-semialdehyde dehydrogenase
MNSTYSGTTGRAISGVAVPEVPTQLFLDGEWRDASDGATFDVIAPASEQPLATVAAASDTVTITL